MNTQPALIKKLGVAISVGLAFSLWSGFSQSRDTSDFAQPFVRQGPTPDQTQSAPVTLTLKDALEMAQKYDPQFLAALNDAAIAQEDAAQARAAVLPTVAFRSDYLGTQGNGKLASGRFVTNDGVHVYRDWLTIHQDLSPGTFLRTGIKRAEVAMAVARAKAQVARRGLAATVTKAYYGLIVAQRKYATAQQALDEARRSLQISQDLERGGEVAHSDVVKFQLTETAQEGAFTEAKLAMETARLDLAVLLFRNFDENFSVVDDLDVAPALPPMPDVEAMAERENPVLAQAMAALRGTELDISIARQAFLPTLSLDPVYGIEANAFALHTPVAAARELGPMPSLGYFVTASLNVPLWDWGVRRSKLRQAEIKREQAGLDLTGVQKTMIRNLHGFYEEAQTARAQVDFLRHAVDLASESLRLNTLRYRAGEATVLELVDAQNALIQARNAYDDGLVRYRVALGNLQTLTGAF